MVTGEELRKALTQLATGVTVITTLEDGGKVHGMTANAFTSVCLEPPLVLVCVDHSANTHRFIRKRGAFGVNILAHGQQGVAAYYARKVNERTGAPPVPYESTPGGCARLEGCLAFLGCKVVDALDYGDHTIYVASVEEVQTQPGKPLLYFQRRYRGLDRDPL